MNGEVPLKAQSTKKKQGQAAQRLLNKFYTKRAKTSKEKTERGEERPDGRTHHCAYCKEAFTFICVAKEHMVPCDDHDTVYTLPGKPCVTCIEEENAELRNEAKEDEKKAKRTKKTNTDTFPLTKARKRPGMKLSRQSFQGSE
ncbi:MAG: hypothetical protein Q9222_005829 [Ikaeria aurantiellina]